jgi:signal transduction histidine kinase
MLSYSGSLVPLFAIAGGLAFLLGHRVLTVDASGQRRASAWWIGFLGLSIVFMVARIVQRGAIEPAIAVDAVRAQYALAMVLAVLAMVSLRTLLGLPVGSRSVVAVAGLAAVVAILTVATDLVMSDQATLRTDALGDSYYVARPAPLLVLVALELVVVAAVLIRLVRTHPAAVPGYRRRLAVSAALLLLVGGNDILLSAGVVPSIQLFEYGFVGLVAISTYYEHAQQRHRQSLLEDAVAERTAQLDGERRALEVALRDRQHSEARFRALADATREAVVLCRGELASDGNLAAHELFGRPAGELAGVPVIDLFAADQADRRAVLADATTAPAEVLARRASGETFRAEVVVRPAGDHDQRVVLVRDVSTERARQARALLADKLAALGTLAGGAAHEINNPLAYILGNTELLAAWAARTDTGVSADDAAYLQALTADILHGGQRIRHIVLELLAFARERPLAATTIDPVEVLERAIALVAHQARLRASLELDLAPVPPIRGDAAQLGQVFMNLLVNAIQAIEPGRAADHHIRVSCHLDGGEVLIEITDSGPGIAPGARRRVFEPFFTTRTVGQGSGLGLSASLGIIEDLGGRLELDSPVGGGTAARVFLPVAAPTTTSPPPAPRPWPAPLVPHILVVDDDPRMTAMLDRALAPCTTRAVPGVAAALAALASGPFDAVICDLVMPDGTGMDLAEHLARQHPELVDRVLYLTGGAFTGAARAFLATVPDRWLEKPVDGARLRAAIARVTAGPPAAR